MRKPDWREWLRNKNECKKWLNFYSDKKIIRRASLSKEDYFRKSLHNFDFGNFILDKHKKEIPSIFGKEKFYDWVVTAYYYAIYHSTLALLSLKNLSSKSHFATLYALIYYFYHEKKLSKREIELVAESYEKNIGKEDLELFVDAKGMRERASYGVQASFELYIVSKLKEDTRKFLEKVKRMLEQDMKE